MIPDTRPAAYVEPAPVVAAEELAEEVKVDVGEEDNGEELSKEIAAIDRFLSYPVRQSLPYEI
ncbi:hypothetical protein PYH37_003880 [Sinorhizobium numidicum]|uniref:Uncharacterized protein n=1 Tax=Sinorhizobium numidicum TaxID=680248 RepID=A0ABY8CUJ5_9HYPH|nr:hypothetical protein [Sinorhizobium numidicum]WEX78925.1 hypothetical protein PYH37_003880 [Sinorhizobium numidicum]WEX82321.1 hypothetical protein PYH38_004592 [Sinorhizobium numidicum]